MKKISVAIPAYEMHGKGPGFLRESFDRLAAQTFHDFDVVVSDNSTTDVIKAVCDEYADRLPIAYFQNPDPKHGMSSNVNNAIRMATGAIIKILFLDDLLFDERSLELVAANFDLEKDSWLVTGCIHTRDGADLFKPHVPRYNDRIHLGKNTIGSPSVLAFKKEKALFFDECLKWLMDCDWYKRMYDTFGAPKIMPEVGVIIRTGDHQVTNTEVTAALIERERAYVEQKDRVKGLAPLSLPMVSLVAVSGIDPERAAAALELSMLGVEYREAVLVSHRKPENLSDAITFKQCKDTELASTDPKNTDDYSRFIAYSLADYVDGDYALIVHHNAHVLNPDKWTPDFLAYDYIGAPWSPERHFTAQGTEVRVGNGGFSLRSRRLLNVLNELDLPFTDGGKGYFHEDGLICVYHRERLEEAGIAFAPVETAAAFSHEFDVPESVAAPFGFHDYKRSSRFHRIKKLIRRIKKII